MIFIDTSFLTAVSLSNDALHQRAVLWAQRRLERRLTTEFVICEFVNSLSAVKKRELAHRTLAWLRSEPDISIVEASHFWIESGLGLHSVRLAKDWSLTDCISFEVMRTNGLYQALTHDHHFE